MKSIIVFTIIALFSYQNAAHAENDTVREEAREAARDTKNAAKEVAKDTKRATKKAARRVKDETCHMVNGKMKCMGQKIKHSAQNAGDKIEDIAD